MTGVYRRYVLPELAGASKDIALLGDRTRCV